MLTLRSEITLFLKIFIAILVAIFIVFNMTAISAQVGYQFKEKVEERSPHFLPLADEISEPRVPDSIYIPKTDTFAPIVISDADDNDSLYEALRGGTVLYPGSVYPGQDGNTVILGHSSQFVWSKGDYKSVFSLLNKLEAGDTIKIFFDRREYVYKLSDTQILSVDKANEAVNYSITDGNRLFLSSCWPLGTSWNRIVVTAELVS